MNNASPSLHISYSAVKGVNFQFLLKYIPLT